MATDFASLKKSLDYVTLLVQFGVEVVPNLDFEFTGELLMFLSHLCLPTISNKKSVAWTLNV